MATPEKDLVRIVAAQTFKCRIVGWAIAFVAAAFVGVWPAAAAAWPMAAESMAAEEVNLEVETHLQIFSSWMERQRRQLHQPGLVVGILASERSWTLASGVSDLSRQTPVDGETLFRLGSVSKTFTSLAVVLAQENGRLSVDDPVVKFLPWFRPKSASETPLDVPVVTLWHLLTHTSGLPREAPLPYWTDRKFPDRSELRESIDEVELLFEPGRAYQYSNLGMALLGWALEEATGKEYASVLQTEIFNPLGMTSSAGVLDVVESNPSLKARLATGYLVHDWRREAGLIEGLSGSGAAALDAMPGEDSQPYVPRAPATRALALAPAASVTSSVNDLLLYLEALLPGSVLLSEPARQEMEKVQWLSDSWRSGRGLGFSVSRRGDRTVVGHGGWVAGHRTQIAIDADAGLGVVVLTNSDEGGPGSYVDQFFDFLAPVLEASRSASESETSSLHENSGDFGNLDRFVGTYTDPWGSETEVFTDGVDLLIYEHSYPPTRSLKRAVERVERLSDREFRFAGLRKKPLVFELSDEGEVLRVRTGMNYLLPLGCRFGADLRCVKD